MNPYIKITILNHDDPRKVQAQIKSYGLSAKGVIFHLIETTNTMIDKLKDEDPDFADFMESKETEVTPNARKDLN